MSTITGLNHLTLAVSDLERSVAFYSGLLGFSIRMRKSSSAYLEAGTLWLALVVDPDVRRGPLPEYSHVAFSVGAAELPLLVARLTGAGGGRWQEAEDADSFYFLDPDGHKLELHSGDLESRLEARAASGQPEAAVIKELDESIYDLLEKIRRKPGMYIGGPSFHVLFGFIIGYSAGFGRLGVTLRDKEHFHRFHDWVANRLGFRESTPGWYNMIRDKSANDADAFDYFFRLLDEFRKT